MFLGVDVSKDQLDLALEGPTRKRPFERAVSNDAKGAQRALQWVKERTGCEPAELTVVMEATGVYHEVAALVFHEAGCRVLISNPKRARDFASGLGLLNKTDKVDARALLRYGREKAEELIAWVPAPLEIRVLRSLCARLAAVKEDLQRERNRQQQAQLSAQPAAVQQSLARSIEQLEQECKRLERAIKDHFDQNPDLKNQRELLQSIPSIGAISSMQLLCVLGRQHFSSARQAAAYCGLVPRVHESGTSVRKAPRLTKSGDPALRATLYMAAVVAIKHNRELKRIYQGLLNTGKTKMSALGAIMRRLVHIAFGVLKHQQPYNPTLVAQGC